MARRSRVETCIAMPDRNASVLKRMLRVLSTVQRNNKPARRWIISTTAYDLLLQDAGFYSVETPTSIFGIPFTVEDRGTDEASFTLLTGQDDDDASCIDHSWRCWVKES